MGAVNASVPACLLIVFFFPKAQAEGVAQPGRSVHEFPFLHHSLHPYLALFLLFAPIGRVSDRRIWRLLLVKLEFILLLICNNIERTLHSVIRKELAGPLNPLLVQGRTPADITN